eukprot:scaffold19434_cov114-Isochrysis_galbana.AAC.4
MESSGDCSLWPGAESGHRDSSGPRTSPAAVGLARAVKAAQWRSPCLIGLARAVKAAQWRSPCLMPVAVAIKWGSNLCHQATSKVSVSVCSVSSQLRRQTTNKQQTRRQGRGCGVAGSGACLAMLHVVVVGWQGGRNMNAQECACAWQS